MNKSGRDGYVQASAKGHRASDQRVKTSAHRGAVNARTYTPSDIKDRLAPQHVEVICRDWLPNGKKQGQWYVCCSPWREDSNPSFAVSLTTKTWRDFATGERGDIFDLSMKLWGDSFAETLDGFAEMLGLKNA